ncbi:hypothetical protein [Streptomyces sp. NPDC002922]
MTITACDFGPCWLWRLVLYLARAVFEAPAGWSTGFGATSARGRTRRQ